MAEKKTTGRSGKHAGDRILVTLDPAIYKKFAKMAELEGLPTATKARQVLTMYANNIPSHIYANQGPEIDNKSKEDDKVSNSNEGSSIIDDDSWIDN